MSTKMTKQEQLLAVRKLSYARADSLPLVFTLGGKTYRGIPADYQPVSRKRLIDSTMTETTIIGQKDGLEIRAEVKEYRDFPAVEYTVYFTNKGTEPTEIFSNISAIDADFCGEDPVLESSNGDTCTPNGYFIDSRPIATEPIVLGPVDDGTSCNGAHPYMRVRFEDYTLTAAIGWTGTWQATFAKNEMGINMKAGQKYVNFRILPGETMRTPMILLLISETACHDRAVNMWRSFYFKHIMPKQWGENVPAKLCSHVFSYKSPEFTGATEDSQIFGLKKYLKRGIDLDLWWFDAGFYKCDGHWPTIGTWKEDQARFPNNGLRPLGDECAKNGVDLMVWFEPERACVGSEIDREHPDFLLFNKDDGWNRLFNYGNPEALAWMIDRVDTLIKKWHITVYRQDFNFSPYPYWRQNEAEDRLGALENLSIQGYYAFWDALIFNNPGLFIDSCAGGGRRNDIETMRRAVPFQYTDMGLNDPAQKARQHMWHFEWIPYFRAHTMSDHPVADEYTWFVAFAPAVTFMPACWGSEAEFETGRKMSPIWRKAANLMLRGDYYRQVILPANAELTEWVCEHFYDPAKGDGFVMFLRNRDAEAESFTATLHLEEGFDYEVENPMTGEKYIAPASKLQTLTVSLAKSEGTIFFFTRVK